MARMFPADFPLPDDTGRWAEKVTFESFATLDDEWIVIYSLRWMGHRDGGNSDGEADFLLMHPNFGLLIVEVKGGSEILVKDGQWFSQSRGQLHPIKDPFAQASDSKFALLRWLKKELPGVSLPHLAHFVVFPAHIQKGDISPSGRREIICDRKDLENVQASVERVARFSGSHAPTTKEVLDQIRKKLVPDLRVSLSVRQSVDAALQIQEALTDQQQAIMESVHLNPRVAVRGAAGTGKTVLALNSAIRCASTGHKTLLLCFNRPLAQHLQSLAPKDSNLTIDNIDSFATRVVGDKGEDTSELDLLPYQLADIITETSLSYDAILIDEAQDFKEDWWEAVESMLRDQQSSKLHVFFDSNQNIYEGKGLERFQSIQVELTINCRNTREIAAHVNRIGGLSTPTRAASGPEPVLFTLQPGTDARIQLSRFTFDLIRDYGLDPTEIVIITDTSNARDEIFNYFSTPEFKGTNLEGVRVDTIHRFKGLESEAVICFFEQPDALFPDSRLDRLAYIGLSRAKVVLAVAASEGTFMNLGFRV